MKRIFHGGCIVTPDAVLRDRALLIDEEIVDIIDAKDVVSIEAEENCFEGWLLPGFIDLHIHGAAGSDVMDGTKEALDVISEALLQSGTTAYLATTMTMEEAHILKALDNIRSYMNTRQRGARILGVHLEGPFINPDYRGAQMASFIQRPNLRWVKDYLDIIRIITLAPEMDEDFAFIRALKDQVVLSMGHTGADYDTAMQAHAAGVSHVTHCFNAMTGMHHRNPGVVGAALVSDMSVEFITDLVHIHPDLLEPMISLKKPDKAIMVTDAMRAAFLQDGVYELGGQRVWLKDGTCRLENGTIAGSVHRTDQALRNMLLHSGFPLERIVNMLSLNPAKRLGLEDQIGQIKPGTDADLVLLNKDYQVRKVYLKGELHYENSHF